MNEQREKLDKLASDSEMHFNIILGLSLLGLSQDTQSQNICSVSSKKMEEDTVQQTAMAAMEMPSSQGAVKEEPQMEEEHSSHFFS